MRATRIVTPYLAGPDVPIQNLAGLGALAAEFAADGVAGKDLFAHTGIFAGRLDDEHLRISRKERVAIYRNAMRLAKRSDVALSAGARQRITDYGMLGYAMFSSRTFGDALVSLFDHLALAGPVAQQISLCVEGERTVVLRSHGLDSLGELVPFIAEFWRSSMTALFSRVLEARFPTKRMTFPFAAPAHWRKYEQLFNCDIDFGADQMEWHFDASVLDIPCPNANPLTSKICRRLCDTMLAERPDESEFVRRIRSACVSRSSLFPTAVEIARDLGLSVRSFHRKLAADGMSYQSILDDMRQTLAVELLENTRLGIDQIAQRVGFADGTSFRKAFKRWTDRSPSDLRDPEQGTVDSR